jgi:SPP1 family predicted phage head-tail adaptor
MTMGASGGFRDEVEIQSATVARDGKGEPIETWSTYARRQAAVLFDSGREAFRGQREISEQRAQFDFRFDPETRQMTTRMRLVFNERTFGIVSVADLGQRHRVMRVVGEEVV